MRKTWKAFCSWSRLEPIFSAVLALLLAIFLVGIVVFCAGVNPFSAYAALFKGAFGSMYYIKLTIRYAIPILLIALSFAICERCGYFNIGQEAQMTAAGITAVIFQFQFGQMPDGPLLLLMFVFGIAAAVLISVGTALLKHYFRIPEAIVLVMMCYIMELLSSYLFMYTGMAYPNSATMPRSIDLAPQIPTQAMYAIIFVVFIGYTVFTQKSICGYRIKMVGRNPAFTDTAGISSVKTLIMASAIGGFLAGLAGLLEVLCVYNFMYYNFANGLGFIGISAALLGRGTPVGMLLGALLFGALNSGSVTLAATTGVSGAIVQVIQGFITLFATVSVLALFRKLRKKNVRGRCLQ